MKVNYKSINLQSLPIYVQAIIEEILVREGGDFTDHPNDWPTKWGIRKLSADRAGYTGPIPELTKSDAAKIWTSLFWYGPNMHMIGEVSPLIAETVVDTSGPAGLKVGITHLQEALTSFNSLDKYGHNRYGKDLVLDGLIGVKSANQLKLYVDHRGGQDGERKLATRLNCLQDSHYTKLAIRVPAKRDFSFGWTSGRVFADLVNLANDTDTVLA